MTLESQPVVLAGLPRALFDEAVTYLADIMRECQLILVDRSDGHDPDLIELAEALVPDLEEVGELFRRGRHDVDEDRVSLELELHGGHIGTLVHLQMHLVHLRFLARRGTLLVASDPNVSKLLAWIWDETADQLHGRRPRPYDEGDG